jgi:hypothetical protein
MDVDLQDGHHWGGELATALAPAVRRSSPKSGFGIGFPDSDVLASWALRTLRFEEFLNTLPVTQLAFPVFLKPGSVAVSFRHRCLQFTFDADPSIAASNRVTGWCLRVSRVRCARHGPKLGRSARPSRITEGALRERWRAQFWMANPLYRIAARGRRLIASELERGVSRGPRTATTRAAVGSI